MSRAHMSSYKLPTLKLPLKIWVILDNYVSKAHDAYHESTHLKILLIRNPQLMFEYSLFNFHISMESRRVIDLTSLSQIVGKLKQLLTTFFAMDICETANLRGSLGKTGKSCSLH